MNHLKSLSAYIQQITTSTPFPTKKRAVVRGPLAYLSLILS